jgi:hypothetical protein
MINHHSGVPFIKLSMAQTKNQIKNIYQERIGNYKQKQEKLKVVINRVSWSRLSVLILGGLLAWYLSRFNGNWIIYILSLSLITFLILVKYHDKLLKKQTFNSLLIRINREELAYLDDRWTSFDSGEEFKKRYAMHTADLDVFGDDSLFQKISRSSTLSGKNELAQWFLNPLLDINSIEERQEAILELKDDLDFRQQFRATGMSGEEFRGDYVRMIRWMKEKPWISSNTFLLITRQAIPAINILLTILATGSIVPWSAVGIALVLTLGFLAPFQKRINKSYLLLNRRAKLLLKYVEMLRLMEDKNFTSHCLVQLQKDMLTQDKKAWENIHVLAKLLQRMDQRLNMIMGILLNVYLLWDIRILYRVEKWKKQHQEHMITWFHTIGKMDAFCSLANLAYNEPHWIVPKPSHEILYEGVEMRHPLMANESCIPNSISIDKKPYFFIVTGANMAGKSTWLRTLGSNLLLARMGAVVHAKSMHFKPARIATSLRTNDSLMKNESYFYSELKRLKEIITMLQNGDPVFVLLDEILKGTNSGDKEAGSIALLKQLIDLKAYGIIATHDLNLAKISDQYKEFTCNQRFEAEIIEDKLFFDYQLKEGVAQNFNATFLMKKMGITL